MAEDPCDSLLTILHTNDLHGHAHLPGVAQGLARLTPLIRQVRAEMPNVLLLDAGDIIHGTPEEKAFAGRPLLTAMNLLEYDAATLGNHEFDFGQDRTRDIMDFAHFPMLSANLVDEQTGKPWADVPPCCIIERDGIRVGIFGLTTPTTVQIEWPRTLVGIQFTDPTEAANRMVSHLRSAERADVVIALSHLGYNPDLLLAEAVPGIDLILGGHTHTFLPEQVWVGDTLIVQTGAFGKALSRVDLIVRRAEESEPGRVLAINGRDGLWWGYDGIAAPQNKVYPRGPLLLAADVTEDDPAVVEAYAPFRVPMQERLQEILTEAVDALPAAGATQQETAIGNLLADAVRAQSGTDIAFAASSQIAPDGLEAGTLRVAELYRLLPAYTRQHIVIVRVPGALLQETLYAVSADPEKLPVHLSGAMISADSIAVGDSSLRPDQTYTVAAAAHIIQDYLYGKPGVTVIQDDVLAPTFRDLTIDYLRGHAPLRNAFTPRWQNRPGLGKVPEGL